MTTAEEYRTASPTLFDRAMVELDAGDLRQASEKLWGAAAQALKSLAERRGWEHGSLRELYRIMTRLSSEFDDPEMARFHFDAATQLRINASENWLDEEEIRVCSTDVQKLVDMLTGM